MLLEGTSWDMEITFGQGFGKNRMERYMPLWFELGIPGPGALVSPVRIGREGGQKRTYVSDELPEGVRHSGEMEREGRGEGDPGPDLSSKAAVPGAL